MPPKKKKDNIDLTEMIRDLKNEVKASNLLKQFGSGLPSIIEFVEEERWLGMSHYPQPIHLRPMQRIMLKCFYRGSPGNEHLKLTDEEIEILERSGMTNEENGNVLEKWDNDTIFRELVLVWGRRSGKDFIVSIMALYEAMRLLETPGGNPYATYNLGSAAPITILTIANAAAQARILFREIRDKVHKSPYFQDKVGHMTDDKIMLLTPHDKETNKTLKERGLTGNQGSVHIVAGHSNSNSLVGLSCFAVMFDEIGTYKNTAGSSSGDQLYHNLVPATMTYIRNEIVLNDDGTPKLDDKGNPENKKVLDGKVICISTPRGKEGIFYDLYSNANNVDHRFMMRAPTWVCHPDLTETWLMTENPDMGDAKFSMEFGAEFLGTAGESFFIPEDVDRCFRNTQVKNVRHGLPGITYFAHLDPATSSHNYALCICHKEVFIDSNTGQKDFRIVVDHLHHWSPSNDSHIKVQDVDDYMIQMHRRFHFGLVTYDQWNSKESIVNLRKHGIPAKESAFSRQYKQQIYDNLYQLVINSKILIPEYELLRLEMKNLQRKWTETGFKVMAKKDADINTDDMCDALAGAVFNAMDRVENKLPQGKTINMPVSPQGSGQIWRSMQGIPYGMGSGQSVANQLRNRSQAYPDR